jgi:hypothetical protein
MFNQQDLTSALTFDSFCSLAFGVSFSSLKHTAEFNKKQEFLVAFDDAQVRFFLFCL